MDGRLAVIDKSSDPDLILSGILTGYEKQADGSVKDTSVFTFKPEWDPKVNEIKLSAVFTHSTEERNGNTYQTDMDFSSGALVHFPASEANGLSTVATKSESDNNE